MYITIRVAQIDGYLSNTHSVMLYSTIVHVDFGVTSRYYVFGGDVEDELKTLFDLVGPQEFVGYLNEEFYAV
jgi:hypothetical protein